MFVVYSAEEDTLAVYREVVDLAGSWSNMCLVLGLRPSDRKAIDTAHPGNPCNCLQEVVEKWLQKSYNYQRFGSPTWRMLVEAVGDPAGGDNVTLAETIAKKHPGMHVHTQCTFRHSMMDSSSLSFRSQAIAQSIMAEAVSTIQWRKKNNINHLVLHSPPIFLKELKLVG